MIGWPVGHGIGVPAAMGRFPVQHLEDAASSRGRPSHRWDWACPARAVLATAAVRSGTPRQSVGACSHAGAWELKEIDA